MEIPLLELQYKATLQSLLVEEDLSYKQEEIVAILGGINGILNHYIASGDIDDDRILRIISVIKQDSKLKVKAKDDTVEDHQISLDPNESILRNIFPKSFCDKLTALVLNKIMMGFFFAAFLSIIVINSIENLVYHKAPDGLLALSIAICLRIPMTLHLIAMVMFINVKALKLLSRTFLFWFKLLYFVQWFALWQLLDHANALKYGALYICDAILVAINVVMVIILVSSMDGLHINIWSKRAILSLTLLYFTSTLFAYWLNGDEWYPSASITIAGYQLHLVERLRSVGQTLVIFVARQTIALWRNPTKSTVIRKPTYIRWND